MHDLSSRESGLADQPNAEVLTLALRCAVDAVEFWLTGPRYRGCQVERRPDLDMAGLMLAVAERLRSTPFAPGTSGPKAWKKQVGRLMGLANVLRTDATKPAQTDLVEHFVGVYIADARRDVQARHLEGATSWVSAANL